MPTKPAAAPWQELEAQAYHAYREWPLWLVLRERELAERLAAGRPERHPPGAARAAEGTQRHATGKGDAG